MLVVVASVYRKKFIYMLWYKGPASLENSNSTVVGDQGIERNPK